MKLKVEGGSKTILVLGSTGQIGRALLLQMQKNSQWGFKGIGLTREVLDLSRTNCTLVPFLDEYQPCAVVNAAAYTSVDDAQSNESLAIQVNSIAPAVLARE